MSEKEIKIPDWSASDYRVGTTPFDWLYAYRENRFVMAQLCEQIKVRAGAVGVKNFISLWKAYLAMQESTNKGTAKSMNATAFDSQPLELYCGDYFCNEDGISYIDRYGADVTVCRHPIMPVRRLSNIDTGEIKLELAFKRGGRWKDGIVADKATLASSQKILDLAKYGIAVDSENAKDMVKFITAIEDINYDKLGETKSVGRLGWIQDCGFSPYVDGLRFDGDMMLNQAFLAVRQQGDYEAWLELMRQIRESGTIARIMLAASFSSVLVDPLGCLPFFVHVWGGTEAGKTVGLMAAASVWANPSMGEYIRTFNSTSVAQEVMAGFCNSLPLFLDELQIIKDRADFDKTIYTLTEGIGRGRGAKSGGMQRTYTWRNCIVTTGEMPISNANSGGGAVNRIIEIDCKDEKLFSDPRGVANAVRRNYGHAGRKFVETLTDSMDEAKAAYQKYYAELSSGEATEKQSMAAAVVLAADELATKWIFRDGRQLEISDLAQYLTSKDDVDVNKRALEWVYEFVAENKSRFTAEANNGELWGDIDDDRIYIIKSVFDRYMMEAGFNSSSFLSWAKRNEFLQCEAGHTTVKHKINDLAVKPRCVCILQSKTKESVQNDELPF